MVDIPLIRTSERKDFKRCPQRWWWAWRDGLKHKTTANPLWFGQGIHLALAHYYGKGRKRNKDFVDVWEDFCDNDPLSRTIYDRDSEKWEDARELGRIMLLGYAVHYQGDKDWDVIYTEEPFQVEIVDPNNPDITVAIFSSTLDGVYREFSTKKFKLMEHKSAASIGKLDYLNHDDQGGSYWAVANFILRNKGILTGQQFISEITYNFLRKGMPDDRPTNKEGLALNKNGSVSKIQPATLFARYPVKRTQRQAKMQLDRIAGEVAVMNAYRAKQFPLSKTATRDCGWDCQFAQMCDLHESGADWKEFRKAVYDRKDPYAHFRKSASE